MASSILRLMAASALMAGSLALAAQAPSSGQPSGADLAKHLTGWLRTKGITQPSRQYQLFLWQHIYTAPDGTTKLSDKTKTVVMEGYGGSSAGWQPGDTSRTEPPATVMCGAGGRQSVTYERERRESRRFVDIEGFRCREERLEVRGSSSSPDCRIGFEKRHVVICDDLRLVTASSYSGLGDDTAPDAVAPMREFIVYARAQAAAQVGAKPQPPAAPPGSVPAGQGAATLGQTLSPRCRIDDATLDDTRPNPGDSVRVTIDVSNPGQTGLDCAAQVNVRPPGGRVTPLFSQQSSPVFVPGEQRKTIRIDIPVSPSWSGPLDVHVVVAPTGGAATPPTEKVLRMTPFPYSTKCSITFAMPPSPTPPVTVTFRAFCPGLEIDKIRQVMWLVDTTRVAINPPPGLAFTWTFTDPERTYDIQARVYATDGELFGLTSFETGSVGLGPMGTWRNRFEARGAPANLDVCGAWWRGGDGTWSACAPFGGGRIGAVDAYLLHTGEQTEGWNAGFLVAAVAGRPGLRYQVYGFNFPKGSGTVHHEGWLNTHDKTVRPETLAFAEVHSRTVVVQWTAADGAVCKARIWKTRTEPTPSLNSFVKGGVDDLGCSNASYRPAFALDGDWRVDGQSDPGVIRIAQSGYDLAIRLPPGPQRVTGTFTDATTVRVALPAGGAECCTGKVERDAIAWSNGSVWRRATDLSGTLATGRYEVRVAGFQSVWALRVNGAKVSGVSIWDCCPGPRIDAVTGEFRGDELILRRPCNGQGTPDVPPCLQEFRGHLVGTALEGTFTGAGGPGTWRLDLSSRSGLDLRPDALGTEWAEVEAGFPGRWRRRGATNVWDADWGAGTKATLVMSLSGNQVRIVRTDLPGPNSGFSAVYEGTIDADGRVTGIETYTWPARGWKDRQQAWEAVIMR